jgi:hypothetical protein
MFIKVRFFVLERPRMRRTSTSRSLDEDATLDHFPLDIWVFLSIRENSGTRIGIRWRPGLKVNWVDGKENYYHMEIDLSLSIKF